VTIALRVALALSMAAAVQPGGDVAKWQARYRAARIERNIGWGLSAAGIALLAAGAVAVGYASQDNVMTYEQHVAEAIGGAAAMVVGLGLGIPGAVLGLRGQDAMTDVAWRLRAVGALAPAPGGAMATVRVIF
jgi:hypothetical protein